MCEYLSMTLAMLRLCGWQVGATYVCLAIVDRQEGDVASARALLEKALEVRTQAHNHNITNTSDVQQ